MSSEEYLLSLLTPKLDKKYAETTVINQRVCPFVKYHKDRLSVKYVGKGLVHSDISAIQSNNPANRDTMIYYFEVKINDLGSRGDISLGLAEADFPPNKHPGWTKKYKNVSLYLKFPSWVVGVMVTVLMEKSSAARTHHHFVQGDLTMPKFAIGSIVGCGINYLRREIFFTFNGKYYGSAFKNVDLKDYYATLGLHSPGESVTFNFGAKPFKFDIEKLILDQKQEGIKSIMNQPIDHYTIHQIVHSYLLFHGYSNTLDAFEKTTQIERKDTKLIKKDIFEARKKANGDKIEDGNNEIALKRAISKDNEDMDIEYTRKDSSNLLEQEDGHHTMTLAERFRSNSFQIEFESPSFMPRKDSNMSNFETFALNREGSVDPKLRKRSSFNLDMSSNLPHGMTNGNGSLGMLEDSKTNTNESKQKSNPYLLQERGVIRQLIQEGKIQDVFPVIKLISPTLLGENPKITLMLHAQQFIEYIRSGDTFKAIEYAQNYLNQFDKETIFSLNPLGIPVQTPIEKLIALICYADPEQGELGHFLKSEQRDLVTDMINKELLNKIGLYDQSILQLLMGHLIQIEEKIREQNASYGEIFEFKV